MGFLKKFQIGKVAGAIAQGFSTGGFYGAVLQGGKQAAISSVKAGMARASHYGATAAPLGSAGMYNVAAAGFMPGMSGPGMVTDGGMVGTPVKLGSIAAVSGDVYNALMSMLQRIGATVRSPQAVVPMAKRVLARIIATARRVPGMTPVGMLVSLGLTEVVANQVLTWYTTSGKRRRRMRVTNVKALNRSARRLEGFLKLSRRVEGALAMRHTGHRSKRRCTKCRKSPCGC